MESKNYNVLMVGVGGQGIITAGNILSLAAMHQGFDVKKSEIHGMSQRGGSVFSHVRFGPKVYSPVISHGEADLLLSLEEMETLRWLPYVRRQSTVVVCGFKIKPTGVDEYPDDIEKQLKKTCPGLFLIDPPALEARIENRRFFNVALLGVIAPFLNITRQAWEHAVTQTVPQNYVTQNLNAFAQGTDYYSQCYKEGSP